MARCSRFCFVTSLITCDETRLNAVIGNTTDWSVTDVEIGRDLTGAEVLGRGYDILHNHV